ncbi:MAG TPA: hemerythrin domain-containing protein [Polaromonas sp.]
MKTEEPDTQGLTQEHRILEAAWRRLRAALAQIATGEAAPLSSDAMDDFAELYQRHIERQESELPPMAARLLTDEYIARVSQAMRERRGIAGV